MTQRPTRSIEQSCYWLASRNEYVSSPPLKGRQSCQIAVVGAGFTGLWTAYFLKQLDPELDVAVIEQGVVGYGASGRNAGIVGTSVDFSDELAISHFGFREAVELARIGAKNIDELEEYASDCDFERTGQLHVALSEEHLEESHIAVETASALGIDGYRVLNREQVRAELDSPLYCGAIFLPGNGIINPIKLVDKLKHELIAKGVRFFEKSRVTSIDADRVSTADGDITAERIVLATSSYSHHLFPKLLLYFLPVYEYVLASDPLTKEQMSSIGWANRQAVTDDRIFFNYYRLTADNRIVWGGTSHPVYYSPNRVDESCDHSQECFDELNISFNRHFPQLNKLSFPYAWGGAIATTTRLTPFFGSMKKGRILYGLGFSGHGIGSTRLAGKILAHMALARPHELLQLRMVRIKPCPFPPEPLRAVSVDLVTRSLKRLDAGERPSLFLHLLNALGIEFSH